MVDSGFMGERHSRLILTADVLMAVTILATVVLAVSVFRGQRDRDDQATEIAAWAQERGVDRLAWPADLREAVPTLLDAGVVPVLIAEGGPVQQFAVSNTEVVVTRSGRPPPAFAAGSHEVGDLVAYEVDLRKARSIPLEVGESVSVQISRPYRYAPLRPSMVITPAEPFEQELFLDPGRYRVEVEAFTGIGHSPYGSPVRVTFAMADGASMARGARAQVIVEEPLVFDLLVPNWTSPEIRLEIAAAGRTGSPPLMIHAWSVTRTEQW